MKLQMLHKKLFQGEIVGPIISINSNNNSINNKLIIIAAINGEKVDLEILVLIIIMIILDGDFNINKYKYI